MHFPDNSYTRFLESQVYYSMYIFAATNQLPLSPVQIQASPAYYRQPSQDDGRKVGETKHFELKMFFQFSLNILYINVVDI